MSTRYAFAGGGSCIASGVLLSAIAAPGLVAAQTLLGPTPYLSELDSPFAAGIMAATITLEDFEDGALAMASPLRPAPPTRRPTAPTRSTVTMG